MLSPASLRVCCLAVMAPALTKADRQADCLPVVLSESFCISKSRDTFNSEDKLSEIRLKCALSSEYPQNRRKPFMHRACWRTQRSGPGFLNKYRSLAFDSSKSLLPTGKVRTQRDIRYKTWQSTKATTAYADKIKLKYTMSKNTSNFKNMGLAKANTSLGLQSFKKVKQFSKQNQNSGLDVMEDSMNFSDSADSTMQITPLISDIAVVASDSDVSPMDTDTVTCVNNNGRTLVENVSNTVSDTTDEKAVSELVLENDSRPFLTTTGADLMDVTSNISVTLTDSLSSSVENSKSSRTSPVNSISLSSFPVSNLNDAIVDVEVTEIPDSSVRLKTPENVSPVETTEKHKINLLSENDKISLQPVVPKAQSSIFKFLDLKLPVLNSKYSGSHVITSPFPAYPWSKLPIIASRLSDNYEVRNKCPVLTDCRFGLNCTKPIRQEKNTCCVFSSQELESLELLFADRSTGVVSVLAKSTLLMQKETNAHTKKQISSLVEHYQRKYHIPCQRPTKHVNTKSGKDLVDIKAELLQSEDVKNMSTAALVSLVRKLESSGSQARILSPKISVSSSSPDPSENVVLNFDPEDCEDTKHTSSIMLSNFKSLLKVTDPYFTDSSEEETVSETEDEEIPEESTTELDNKKALWKYLAERARLGSSSTWLLARNHELEHRIKEFDERWSDITKAEGNVCLEDPVACPSSALSILGSDNASLQSSVKEVSLKNVPLPLNGFLDRSDVSRVIKSTVSESFPTELEDPDRTESDTDVEGSCCRTKPLNIGAFRKRKLAFIPGLHVTNPKFSRLSSVNCYCNSQNELAPCILCTGQYNSIQGVDSDSMALRDRIAILDPYFHPALSTDKDISICLHMENVFKIEGKSRYAQPVSPEPNTAETEVQVPVKRKFSGLRSHRRLNRYTSSLQAKYRNKRRRDNTKHLRKHKLVFGKWRRLNKHTLRARSRFRRHSVASSGSSPDSPERSPMSVFDDGYERKRRDDSQFNIDDVIIPCNSKSGRMVEIKYKEIVIPSWRTVEEEAFVDDGDTDEENIADSHVIKRHDVLEVEEKEKVKKSSLGIGSALGGICRRRRIRCDSRADSSGANTPDPTSLYNQENVFQIPNFTVIEGQPDSPASPPATPNSAIASDDSQPAFGNSTIRLEKKMILNQKRVMEESSIARSVIDYVEVPPFETVKFPLDDDIYEELLAEADHDKEELDTSYCNSPHFSASPISSSSSTSTVEDDEDMTDPEWTVVKPLRNGPEQALVLKFAKR